MDEPVEEIDVAIVGGGPTGLAAGLYAARASRRTVLWERGVLGGQIAITALVDNYPGFADGVQGPDLAIDMHRQAEKFGMETVYGGVEGLRRDPPHYVLTTADGEVRAKTVIVTSGADPVKLGVPGEEALTGREVECAVLGNAEPQASPLGEIRAPDGFYSYAAKYENDSAELVVPAAISEAAAERVQRCAIDAFRALDCAGLARVDFFVDEEAGGEPAIHVLELNTLPGFTPISMYPRLWQEAGLSYPELITRLLERALGRSRGTRARTGAAHA